VVWNPWQEKAAAMGDMGEQGYLSMLCVESANAMHNAVTIPAGQQHSLWVSYHVEKS
jgi:D-hexose-6-phosphate mutarotase